MGKYGNKKFSESLASDINVCLETDSLVNRPLISDSPRSENTFLVNIDDIEDHPENHEIYGDINSDDIDESIAHSGIHQAPTVCRGTSKKYRCLSGHRRIFACRKAEVQADYKALHEGKELTHIIVIYKGELDEIEQMRILLETNQMRVKTFFNILQESLKEKDVLSKELAQNKLNGVKTERRKVTNEDIGRKYFDVGRDTYKVILDIYEILKDSHQHPMVKQLDGAMASHKKIEWAHIYKKLTKPEDEKRVDSGKPKQVAMQYYDELVKINFDLKKITNKSDAVSAYLCLAKMTRDAKALIKELESH